jgi:hypothetical protein
MNEGEINEKKDILNLCLKCCGQYKVYPSKWTSFDGDPNNNCMKCFICHKILWRD